MAGGPEACSCALVGEQPEPNGGETALLAVGLPIVIFQLMLLFLSVRSQWVHWRRHLRAALGRCLSPKVCRSDNDAGVGGDSTLEACVQEGVKQRVETNTSGAMRILALPMATAVMMICYNLGEHHPRVLSPVQSWAFVGFSAILTANFACPPRCLARRPGLCYSVSMIFNSTFIAAARPDPLYLFMSEAASLLIRVHMGVRYTKVTQVALSNLLYCVVGTYAFSHALGHAFLRLSLMYHIWGVAAVVGSCYSAAAAMEADVRREIEASVLRSESSGLWTLLDMVCDVVVPLGEDLRIIGTASRFGAMVTLQATSVEGARLQDFMPKEEDQAAFEACVGAHPSSDSGLGGMQPRALHVGLRDSLGNIIRAELFCVTSQSPIRRRFFVGIREFSDHMPIPECLVFSAPAGIGAPPSRVRRGPRARRALESDETCSDDASSSDGSDTIPSRSVRRRSRRPLPHAAPGHTSELGVELALAQLMRLCVLPADPGQCCPFHQRVRHLRERLDSVGSIACAPRFRPKCAATQCPECGLLDADRLGRRRPGTCVCFACEGFLRAPSPRTPHRASL